ncbi:uncharacterized protein BDW47DRAFT_94713 [Aspergillus candidus]|uniref:Uncharacterized protein n=1 Tax=Aspergillus candidus TaxID=41067 RepID=A0A2I2FIB9_ASPCN|nr:hypothetical protein BDW47DRAFT_94713 [Aspergillus candidus]PLB40364.1 hypothetical protein BDW47DRAFT_94713 [Aspergillus candidus]
MSRSRLSPPILGHRSAIIASCHVILSDALRLSSRPFHVCRSGEVDRNHECSSSNRPQQGGGSQRWPWRVLGESGLTPIGMIRGAAKKKKENTRQSSASCLNRGV